MPKEKVASKDDVELCAVLHERTQRGHGTAQCTCHDAWLGGGCQCALDVEPEEALRDPWEAATSGGADPAAREAERGTTGAPGLVKLLQKMQAAAREARERCWRYVFVTLPHEPGRKNKPRKTPSGSWRQHDRGDLTSPATCVGYERTGFKFEYADAEATQAGDQGEWVMVEYCQPARGGGASGSAAAEGDQLVLRCFRRTDVFLSLSRATDADGVYQEFMAALFQKRGRHATALHEAAHRGDVPAALAAAAQQVGGVDAVLAAMEGGASGEGSGDDRVVAALEAEAAGGRGAKRTPLQIAAMRGRAPAVEALLRAARDAGGDDALAKQLFITDTAGLTPLMLAAKASSAATCKVLLNAGGDELMVKQLRAVGAAQTPLMHAAAARSAAACEALLPAALAAGVLDQATDRGRTALHSAALAGGADAVRVLLRAGADALIASNDGKNTPLHAAAMNSHTDVALLLLLGAKDFDALWNARNCNRKTAAEEAWELGIDLAAELAAARGALAAAGGAADDDPLGKRPRA